MRKGIIYRFWVRNRWCMFLSACSCSLQQALLVDANSMLCFETAYLQKFFLLMRDQTSSKYWWWSLVCMSVETLSLERFSNMNICSSDGLWITCYLHLMFRCRELITPHFPAVYGWAIPHCFASEIKSRKGNRRNIVYQISHRMLREKVEQLSDMITEKESHMCIKRVSNLLAAPAGRNHLDHNIEIHREQAAISSS